MRTEHHGDGVTTYTYNRDEAIVPSVQEVRASVERIEGMCRDILTALSLLIDLLPEAHGESDESGDTRL